jgi:hypothetical protein
VKNTAENPFQSRLLKQFLQMSTPETGHNKTAQKGGTKRHLYYKRY